MAHKKKKRTPFEVAQARAAHRSRQQARARDGDAEQGRSAIPATATHAPERELRRGDPQLEALAVKFADASFMRRFRRAEQELDATVRDWKAWGSTVKMRTVTDRGLSRVVLEFPDPLPDSLHEHVGDCLENLRKALDHLVFALATREKGELTKQQEHGTAFPIVVDRPPASDKRPWRGISLVPPAAADIVRAVQPFAAFPDDPRESPLSMLKVLAERSKHQTAISATTSGAGRPEPRNQHHIEIGNLKWSRIDMVAGKPNVVVEADQATMAQFLPRAYAELRIRGSRSSLEDRETIAVLREIIAYVDTEVIVPLLPVLAGVGE